MTKLIITILLLASSSAALANKANSGASVQAVASARIISAESVSMQSVMKGQLFTGERSKKAALFRSVNPDSSVDGQRLIVTEFH